MSDTVIGTVSEEVALLMRQRQAPQMTRITKPPILSSIGAFFGTNSGKVTASGTAASVIAGDGFVAVAGVVCSLVGVLVTVVKAIYDYRQNKKVTDADNQRKAEEHALHIELVKAQIAKEHAATEKLKRARTIMETITHDEQR